MRQYVTFLAASLLGLAWAMWLPPANAGLVDEAVVFYDFEGTGQTVVDRSGTTAIDLTLGSTSGTDVNDPTRGPGKRGQGLTFDRAVNGSEDFVTSGGDQDRLDFNANQAFSVAGWFRRTDTDNSHQLINKEEPTGSNRGWRLLWRSDASSTGDAPDAIGFLLRGLDESNSDGRLIIRSDPVTTTDWVHIAAVYDGTASNTSVSFYINGQLGNSFVRLNSLAPSAVTNHAAPFYLGGRDNVGTFQGDMDEVGVWDRALTASEVQSLIIPEPASAALAGIGGVLLLSRRSRTRSFCGC
jgi:hypothetical protein